MARAYEGDTLAIHCGRLANPKVFFFAHDRGKTAADTNLGESFFQSIKNEQYGTFSHPGTLHYEAVKAKELTLKQLLSVVCSTCGAEIEEPCELNSGAPRSEPHRERKLSAAEAVGSQMRKR